MHSFSKRLVMSAGTVAFGVGILLNFPFTPVAQASRANQTFHVYSVANGDFEQVAANSASDTSEASGWEISATRGNASVSSDSYYGQHALQLENTGGPKSSIMVSQSIATGKSNTHPHTGDRVEAGAWIKLLSDAKPAKGSAIKLLVQAVEAAGSKKITLAQTSVTQLPKGVWTYVLTQPIKNQAVPQKTTSIELSIQDSVQGGAMVDFVQAGQLDSLTGEPQKYVIAEYQPWYGSPGNWHYWAWNQGGGPAHNPDNILPNGLRDTATFYYPLVGTYDSKDVHLLHYQVDLMKAMGVDCILVDWYANLQPDYAKTLDELIHIADESDMKVSVFYEPKIYLSNWIPLKTRQAQTHAMVQDITGFLKTYGTHKSILKVRNRPVIGVFGATTTGLMSSEWPGILNAIHHKGFNPYMIGDNASTDPPSSFDGMMNWIIYGQTLKWGHSHSDVMSYSKSINRISSIWASGDPAHRLGVGIVWPGFNDSGVYGWGAGARVIPQTNDFYAATWDGMMKQGLNWVVIATFNDWDESTAIEPSIQLGYSRAITTSQYIAKFKGIRPVDSSVFPKILQEYDSQAPITTVMVNGDASADGNSYNSPVDVSLSATDEQSGVSATYYSTDGGKSWTKYAKSIHFSNSGDYTIEYYSVDRVGNREQSTAPLTFTIQ